MMEESAHFVIDIVASSLEMLESSNGMWRFLDAAGGYYSVSMYLAF